jgi:hypothetical protein
VCVRPTLLLASSLLLFPGAAPAYDFTIDSQTALQAYDITGPGGTPSRSRKRILQSLRLGAYDFIERAPDAPRLSVVLALRLDSDFGVASDEVDTDEVQTRYVPGLVAHDVDLTYGWVDGQGFLGGVLDFRLGRQFVVDSLGWSSFDGGLVRVQTPWFVRVEGYGGIEVRGGNPLSPSTFEIDGTQRLPRGGLDPATYPAIEEPALAPVWGVALESTGVMWIHGRASYREVQSEGRIQQRKAAYSATLNPVEPLTIRAAAVWDMHLAFVSEVNGGVEVQVAEPVVVGAEFVHFTPTFDGDSIWNFFPVEPMNYARLRMQLELADGLDASALGFARLLSATDSSDERHFVTDAGGSASLRGYNRVAELQGRIHGSDGFGGLRLGADAWAMRRFWNDRLAATLRLSVWRWNRREQGDTTAFSYVVGGEYHFSRPAKLLVELEHDIDDLVGHRLRLLALLDLRFTP